jgi:hypothetical protein
LSWIGTAVTLHRPLARQKNASPTTVASYRDTCKLLLAFARHQTGKEPSSLSLANLNATLIGCVPEHLEEVKGSLAEPSRPAPSAGARAAGG